MSLRGESTRMLTGRHFFIRELQQGRTKNKFQPELRLALFFDYSDLEYAHMTPQQKGRYERQARIHNKELAKKLGIKYVPEKPAERKKKGPKDPNAPKRPVNAYLLFAKDQRATVRKKYPTYKGKDFTKMLGTMWTKADPGTRKRYTAMALKEQKRYQMEMEEYKKKKKNSAEDPQHEASSEGEEDSEMKSNEEDDE